MAKMLFAMLSLGSMLLAAGDLAAATDTECALDGAKAVDSATDAAIYIWAATKRCGNPKDLTSKTHLTDSHVKCWMDITSAATAVDNVANIIVAALDKCGVIKVAGNECGLSAAKLVTAVGGFSSSIIGMLGGCKKPGKSENLADIKLDRDTDLGQCLIDAKDALASIFDAAAILNNLDKNNHGDKSLEKNALGVISALASLGQFVAAAVSDCSTAGGKPNKNAECASGTLGAISELHSIAALGESMAATCKSTASRLYLENGKNTGAITKNSMSLTLAAFLPVAAVLGFVFGRRFSKARAIHAMIPGEDEVSMIQ